MLTITYTWQCDLCGLEYVWPRLITELTLTFCAVPRGWSIVDSKLACPAHKIEIDKSPSTESVCTHWPMCR